MPFFYLILKDKHHKSIKITIFDADTASAPQSSFMVTRHREVGFKLALPRFGSYAAVK
jgi:hypothetical protein